ncbi:4-oxalocrotonate decarboxylase [Gordonia sihwensis]|uniref:2-keto-4-pentenoate hydratase n=1 Tax=Gordonia TaxID=2053 RepID=UPI001C92E4C6|nr:fumarylacetoacetate hydrolase family protein [Gordonia sihwensis]MBY4570576.1 4-oxalocrotonate decarboxylase [Gordonia sihwensis]WFN91288.1 fumarylacetoacetate hydrolase family protein [Gordonia sihwensis]
MHTTDDEAAALAGRLDHAQTGCRETPSIERDPAVGIAFDVDLAYRVQEELIGLRTARGESVLGVKLGFTSKAKMAQMGVSDVIVGRLTDAMTVANGGTVDLGKFIHPKAEPEVAYLLSRDVRLDDPNEDILDAVSAVAPAVEVIDSRYLDFAFTYADVVADNTSAAGYAIGEWSPLCDAADLDVTLRVGADSVHGSTAAILGDPAQALLALLDMCRRRRIPLEAGHVILAGAATAALPLTASTPDGTDVQCTVEGLGTVSFTAVGEAARR